MAVRLRLDGANAEARAEAGERLPGKSHYFRGADRSTWRRDVPHFGRVTFREVYPGTDLTYYGREGVEHDFVVSPGADPDRIRFTVAGGTRCASIGGRSRPDDALGDVRQRAPQSRTRSGTAGARSSRARTASNHGAAGSASGSGRTTRGVPLVIDPVLSYSSFLGGSARTAARTSPSRPTGRSGFLGTTFSADLPEAGNGHERRPGRVRLPLLR